MIVSGRTLVTAPAAEPVTLAQAKGHLHEDGTGQDSLLSDIWIPAAREWVEKKAWRALVTQTWDFTFYRFPLGREIDVPLPPLQSVTSVTYFDGDNVTQTLSADDYIVDTSMEPGVIRLKTGETWPDTYARPGAVTVRAVVGYGDAADVPSHFRHAMLLLIEDWYDNPIGAGKVSSRLEAAVGALINLDHARAMIG